MACMLSSLEGLRGLHRTMEPSWFTDDRDDSLQQRMLGLKALARKQPTEKLSRYLGSMDKELQVFSHTLIVQGLSVGTVKFTQARAAGTQGQRSSCCCWCCSRGGGCRNPSSACSQADAWSCGVCGRESRACDPAPACGPGHACMHACRCSRRPLLIHRPCASALQPLPAHRRMPR